MRLLALISCLLFIGGCSSNTEKAEKPAALAKFDASISLKKNWSATVGAGQNKHKYTRFFPAIENEVIYSSDVKGNVYAFDVNSGKRLWKVSTKLPITGSISVSNGRLFLGTNDAQVVALSADNGSELWRADVTGEVLAPPASNSRIVVVQTADSRLFAFDSITGKLKWKYDHVTPVLTLHTTAAPVLSLTQVIAGFDNGQAVSVSLSDGATLWKARVAQPKGRTELDRIVDVDAHPVIGGALVFLASYQGNIVALNRGKGSLVWKRPESTFNNLSVDSSAVYSTSEDSIVTARNTVTGDVLWQNTELRLRNIGAPVVFGDYVAVIDDSGYMHIMSKNTGDFAYRFKPKGNNFRSPMMVHKDQLIVLSDNGTLTSYSLK